MSTPVAATRGPIFDVPIASAAKRFGKYKDETENAVRSARVEKDGTIERIIDSWARYKFGYALGNHIFSMYDDALKALGGLSCTPIDVERFSEMLMGFQDEWHFPAKAGIFLSALINSASGDGFKIHTEILSEPLAWLGVLNRKSISTIGQPAGSERDNHGNRGIPCHETGFHATCGTICINGSAINIGDHLSGGTIIVNGPARGEIGYKMKSGAIAIFGDVDERLSEVAEGMTGGEIRIYGDFDESALYGPICGKIYHRGKLIADK